MFKRGLSVYGLDPSEGMLNIARGLSTDVIWQKGVAEKIPFSNLMFSGAIATLTIHHWNNIEIGFSEINRILKLGSYFVLFTAFQKQMHAYWLNHYFPKLMNASIQKMPTHQSIVRNAKNQGFRILIELPYFIQDNLEDLFLYSGKNVPDLYFSDVIRSGMSSFAGQSDKDEINIGLEKLRKDLQSDSFNTIKSKFNDHLGDYSFFVLEKIET